MQAYHIYRKNGSGKASVLDALLHKDKHTLEYLEIRKEFEFGNLITAYYRKRVCPFTQHVLIAGDHSNDLI